MGKVVMVVILSEAKNLIISKESIIEILRLPTQNNINDTISKEVGGWGRTIGVEHGRSLE
jgi:hypothetical protein